MGVLCVELGFSEISNVSGRGDLHTALGIKRLVYSLHGTIQNFLIPLQILVERCHEVLSVDR